MTLSQIDGKENPKIQTINFKDFPIKTARFSASGNEFIVGSKFHPHFFVYDMLAGQTVKVQYCEYVNLFVQKDKRFFFVNTLALYVVHMSVSHGLINLDHIDFKSSSQFKLQVPWRNKSQEFNSAKFDVSPDGKLLA